MLLTQNEFELWCERLKFSPETRVLVAGIRAAEPSLRAKSAYYHIFHDRSERELMMATAELRRRHQNHQRRLTITAGKLASFLKLRG
jgi:hypothetical protein